MEVQPLPCLPVSAGAGRLLTSFHVPFWGSLLFIPGLGSAFLVSGGVAEAGQLQEAASEVAGSSVGRGRAGLVTSY